MTLGLYDSATRQVAPFVPLTPGKVGIYVCGATVQSAPHIGHLRPAVSFDILRRWLERKGYQVTLIRNITDIDDKILAKSAEAGTEWWAHAANIERLFSQAYDALGVLPPTFEPRATGHVPEMIELMRRLEDNGHAYTTGPGDVWFDVESWPTYGELTRQKLDELEPEPSDSAAIGDEPLKASKKSPYDFALWKAPKKHEPRTASWETPWGRGRPGWHLECTAMATKYLGPQFDIHGGGLDLRFPHHENEQAQARAAGDPFAKHWMHTAWITQSGAKMSKSLGNGLLADEVLKRAPGYVVRYAIAAVQYRSMLEWTPETLTDAANAVERIRGFVSRGTEKLGTNAPTREEILQAELPSEFVTAMDDDLNTPEAFAVIHNHLRAGNTALAAAASEAELRKELVSVRAMLDVFGLDPLDPHWATASTQDDKAAHALDQLVQADLAARTEARVSKDWAKADEIRDRLAKAGIVIEDSPAGPRWSLARPVG